MSLYQKSPESARASSSGDATVRISSMGSHPFHPGLFGRYATQIAHFHANLDVINPHQVSQVEAEHIQQLMSELTSSLNRLHQEIAVAARPGYAMAQNSDLGDRAKQLFKDAIDMAKIYLSGNQEAKETIQKLCKKARNNVNLVPILDGQNVTGKDFWARWQYYVDQYPLPDVEKFDLLLSRTSGEPRESIKHLPFDEKSYTDATDILQSF